MLIVPPGNVYPKLRKMTNRMRRENGWRGRKAGGGGVWSVVKGLCIATGNFGWLYHKTHHALCCTVATCVHTAPACLPCQRATKELVTTSCSVTTVPCAQQSLIFRIVWYIGLRNPQQIETYCTVHRKTNILTNFDWNILIERKYYKNGDNVKLVHKIKHIILYCARWVAFLAPLVNR
jgi:hypothetical protein